MKKVFIVAQIRDLQTQVAKGKISYSRMVEILNEAAHLAYSKVEKLPLPVGGKRYYKCQICKCKYDTSKFIPYWLNDKDTVHTDSKGVICKGKYKEVNIKEYNTL